MFILGLFLVSSARIRVQSNLYFSYTTSFIHCLNQIILSLLPLRPPSSDCLLLSNRRFKQHPVWDSCAHFQSCVPEMITQSTAGRFFVRQTGSWCDFGSLDKWHLSI